MTYATIDYMEYCNVKTLQLFLLYFILFCEILHEFVVMQIFSSNTKNPLN